ncbi:hypothetical protein JD844_017744 [Phrynosoma platyrhinos]|uniref:Nucleoside-diphosphate kinase n=1 Tax=Phrynosoma platyrhinos TaxID=52577 RepID=A0ABQ7SMJ0_PHRPL|nr:hypothetical protein JD844_017744 [Phrynosoma platyrhinos]
MVDLILFVLTCEGGPGSGKGTQCEKLAQKYGFTYLSMEELIQHEMSSLTERSKIIRDTMETGELIPGVGDPSFLLCMDCSSKTMSSRLLKKSQSNQCLDDNAEAIMKLIETYYQSAEPVMMYYENRIPVFKINAEGTPEEVFLEACSSIDAFLKKEGSASPLSVDTV